MAKISYVGNVLDNLVAENCKVTTERIDNRHWIVQIYEPDGTITSLDFVTWDKPLVSTDRDAELSLERKSGTCPLCQGQGYTPAGTTANRRCDACRGTGHV